MVLSYSRKHNCSTMSPPFGTGLRVCSQAFIAGLRTTRSAGRFSVSAVIQAALVLVSNSGLPGPHFCHAELSGR